MNQTEVSHEHVCRMFTDKKFIETHYKEQADEERKFSEEDMKHKSLDLSLISLT